MKNKLFCFVVQFLVVVFFIYIPTAHAFTFKTSQIEVLENGNIIIATDGIATSIDNKIEIEAQKFRYNKELSTLKAEDGVASSYINNIEIKAKNIIYNEITSIIDAKGNVELRDLSKKILIKSENIIFDIKKETIKSKTDSIITDQIGNIFLSNAFTYSLKNDLVKIKNVKFTDPEKNILVAEKAYINLKSNRFVAKDVSIDFNNSSFESENEPRLKGNSISIVNKDSILTKGIFTTCKKNDDCPPWSMSAEEIKHDKTKQTIFYKNAWLRVYDIPVFYFPRFFHPDPTVKRQSGFLMPTMQSSTSLGNSLNIPYYFALADNRDLTLNTRLYSEDKILIQSEYREVKATSKSNIDFSITNQNSNTTKNHFFANTTNRLDLNNFDESELNLNVEFVSDDTYLKTYKLKSPLIKSESVLRSNIGISAFREDLSIVSNLYVYEDLTKINSDRYEFIYPDYKLEKKIDNNFDVFGNLFLNSSGYMKSYNTNVFEQVVINDLIFNSNTKITESGFKNEYNLKLKNVNSDSKNSSNFKDTKDHKLLSIAQFDTSYPLKKIGNKYDNVFKPMVSFKYSPNSTKNIKNDDRRIDINNIFSFDRLGKNETVEGGTSMTYGSQFFVNNKLEREVFNVNLANTLRLEEERNLPQNSNLWKKTSDFVGNLKYDPADFFNIKYDFSLSENISDFNYQKLDTQIQVNNFVTTFSYLNENNKLNNQSYISNLTSYKFNNSNNLSLETRVNKVTEATEFYNLIYQYRNDCLIAAIEYNKDFYDIGDMKPEENIFFKLTIIPFGQTSSPNLKK